MGEEILVHHGIKGQKWGVRRYQNQDGSRTALGRQHYGYKTGSATDSSSEEGKQRSRLFARKNTIGSAQSKSNKDGKTRYNVSTEKSSEDVDYYGYKIRDDLTRHKITSTNGTESGKKKVDDLAKDKDFDSAMEFDAKASKVIQEYVKNGKEEALKVLDDEFGDYTYSMIIDDDNYVDFGQNYVTYTLTVMGNTSAYFVNGDADSSDEATFMRIKK